VEKGFGIGDANIFDLQNVFNPVKKFASDVIADVKENKADLLPYMGIGATTDLIGAPADLYSLYGQLRKSMGVPNLASVIGPRLEEVIGSEVLKEKLALPALKQMGIEPKEGTYTEFIGRGIGLPGAGLAVKAGTDISKGLGEVALKALKPDEVAITPEGFAMPVPKDSSVLEMSGKASGVGQYSDELTKQIEGLADTNPDIYKSAQAMIKGNNPEDRIKKMIESRLAPKQKVFTGKIERDLNFVPTANVFPEDPKMYLDQNYKYKDPNVKRLEAFDLTNSRTNYNTTPFADERSQFVEQRPIHFNSVVLTREALTNSPDGRLTGKEIYNHIKNSQLKAGEEFNVDTGKLKISYAGVKDKELKDTGLDKLKDNDDIFELSPDQQTLINLSNPKTPIITHAASGTPIATASRGDISLRQNEIVSRSNFKSDYPPPEKEDLDEIPGIEGSDIDMRDLPNMFEGNQRIGGLELANDETLDYGMITLNDPKSDFRPHIAGDEVPYPLTQGNIAWSRVSVRAHPNGKTYLVPEEFQSDLHTKAQGTAAEPGKGYKPTEKQREQLEVDFQNKHQVFDQERRKIRQEIEKNFEDATYDSNYRNILNNIADIPDELKPDYSVIGKDTNTLIRMKELYEDAVVEYLGNPSMQTNPSINVPSGVSSNIFRDFNNVSNLISGLTSTNVKRLLPDANIGPALTKFINAKNDLAKKDFEKQFGVPARSSDIDPYSVKKNIIEYYDNKNIPIDRELNPDYTISKELVRFEDSLSKILAKSMNTDNARFSAITDLHIGISETIETMDNFPEVRKSIYKNIWETIENLKKDPFYQDGLTKGERDFNINDRKEYIKNKFFEKADPTGELEVKDHIQLAFVEDTFEQLIDDVATLFSPDKLSNDINRNIDFVESLGEFDVRPAQEGYLLDEKSEKIKTYLNSKKEMEDALQKSINISDLEYSPLPQQSEWTKALMRDLMRIAADRGLDGVVLPNAKAYKYAGGRKDSLIKGYEKTTIPAFKDVAKEIGEDVETIVWKGWTEDTITGNNTHLVIPVNKNLSYSSFKGYKEGGQVGSLANVNVLDLGERVNG